MDKNYRKFKELIGKTESIIGSGLKGYYLNNCMPFQIDFYWHIQPIPQALLQLYRVVGSYQVVSKGYINTKNSQIASIGSIFSFTQLSHKAAKSMPNELISQQCGKLQLACLAVRGCLFVQGRWSHFKDYPSTHGYHDSSLKSATAKAARATFSTNTCLNCQLMCTAII